MFDIKNKKIFWITLAIIFVIALIIAGFFIFRLNNKNQEEKTKETKTESEDCSPTFTKTFTDLTKIDSIQPIGQITAASFGRSYITISEGKEVPVYVPADATLTSAVYAYRGPDVDYGEYGFWFDAGCGVTFLLDHLDKAAEKFKKLAPSEPSKTTQADNKISVKVKAGELLGYTNGTEQARTFDFLVQDENNEIFHINPERWTWDQSLKSVCPYDFYTKDLKDEFYSKIGVMNMGQFQKAESCGSPSHDIKDTLSGGWFGKDATDQKGQFLIVGKMFGRVDLVIKIDGQQELRITDYKSRKFPEDIKKTGSICYSDNNENKWAYLNMILENELQVATGTGVCPARFLGTNITTYNR